MKSASTPPVLNKSSASHADEVMHNGQRSESLSHRKPTVLMLVATYLPGFKSGGPIRSTASLVDALGHEIAFKIITRDRDAGDTQSYPGIAPDAWKKLGNAEVFYASQRSMSLVSLRRYINCIPHDILYLNSFFSFDFAIKPLILRRFRAVQQRPVILAPRGQFSKSAVALKTLKKQAFLTVGRLMGLYADLTWQATSAHEVEDIRRVIGANVKIVLAEVPRVDTSKSGKPENGRPPKRTGAVRIALLGRIARMKNVHFAIGRLVDLEGDVLFDIFGPMEDEKYWHECQAIIKSTPGNVTVRYRGAVPHEDVASVLGRYDLFFLPSKGENFGHAILDAMIAGCPVLISDRTPWRNLQDHGCGWDIPLERPDEFRRILQHVVALDEAALAELAKKAQHFGREQIQRVDVIGHNRDLFLS